MTTPDTLLMLSGGIDSTYCLWDRVRRGLPTRTHHVVLVDADGRQDVEAKAVSDILAWMDRNGGAGLIVHTESRVDFGDFIPLGLWNGHLWAYWIGVIMRSEANIRNVVIGVQADDTPHTYSGRETRAHNDLSYRRGAVAVAFRSPNLVYPAQDLTKAQIVREMPPDLFALCWWCRVPQDGQPCHKCRTCVLVDAALKRR